MILIIDIVDYRILYNISLYLPFRLVHCFLECFVIKVDITGKFKLSFKSACSSYVHVSNLISVEKQWIYSIIPLIFHSAPLNFSVRVKFLTNCQKSCRCCLFILVSGQLAPWRIRPRQLAPILQTTSPLFFYPLSSQMSR